MPAKSTQMVTLNISEHFKYFRFSFFYLIEVDTDSSAWAELILKCSFLGDILICFGFTQSTVQKALIRK